jgi:phosphocarrier protein
MEQSISKENNQSSEKELIVKNKLGVHARPAAMIVRITSNYSGDVWVEKDGEQINGKSIMGLMMLAAGNGSKLNFLLEGPVEEAKDVLAQLEKLFEQCFEEN